MRYPTFAGHNRLRFFSRAFSRAFSRDAARPFAAVLLVSVSLAVLTACDRAPAPAAFKANSGQIQVLNGSGRTGQADVFRTYLIEQGFDVIESGNARSWSYEHTLVLARTASDTIARDLARVLGTGRIVHLKHPASLVEATVIIGKDYKELMRTWQQRP